ncbi:MAG: glucose-6-phosphate isomerase [Clostridia bacterium]|nr:glucose-6-phosphate isomerase [Clostridia bacterium]
MSFNIDFENCGGIFSLPEFEEYRLRAVRAHEKLLTGAGEGSDMTLWHELPRITGEKELAEIKECAAEIQKTSDAFILIGIGGSYAGARGAIEFVKGRSYNLTAKDTPRIFYSGCDLSPDSINTVIDLTRDCDYSLNVVSKSGTTLEPALAFKIFYELMTKRYGESGAAKRIYVTTDPKKGVLRELSKKRGYRAFDVPPGVGGRYSVLTPVGLLPMAVCGVDIDEVMRGARDAYADFLNPDFDKNLCLMYAAARNYLYSREGKCVEIFASFEPGLHAFGEWLKQLFAESEGKNRGGIFPVFSAFSTDLHSIGQYIQDGAKNQFETIIWPKEPISDITVSKNNTGDGLSYLSGMKLSEINRYAMISSASAHRDGGVPNLTISFTRADAYSYGYLVYFFEKACALSGYILGVNPFDQPGVEAYKRYMRKLLKKPDA